MDLQTAHYLLEKVKEPTELSNLINLLKKHLSLDNNKLREDYVCSHLGYKPSFEGAGFPDGYKPDGSPVDIKSGHSIVFPDGENTIENKLDWVCLVSKWTKDGKLIYIAEVKVSEIIEELREDRDRKRNRGGRISPTVSSAIWKDKPSTKLFYKDVSLFERLKTGGFKAPYYDLNLLPYDNKVAQYSSY